MSEPFRVLFVCTANICRSPAAEYLARDMFGEAEFLFRSAGFLYDGRPITDKMADTLRAVGVGGTEAHRSHIVEDETLHAAELIFTMEARHLRDLTIRDRSFFDKTVPLREAAERLQEPRTTADFLAELEGREPAAYFDESWDVADPYKRSARHYREAVDTIRTVVSDVITNLKVDPSP